MSGDARQWFGIRAVAWVLDEAPDMPPNLVATLIGVARHAGDDGRNAFPSIETLMDYTRKSRRQVKYDLADLTKRGLLIVSADQGAASRIRADRRPTVYELPLWLKRETVCNQLHAVERGATHCTPQSERGATGGKAGCNTASDEVQPTAPEEAVKEPIENINGTPSPVAPSTDVEVVDAEILEEGEGLTSSLETQMQTLTDEIRAVRPNWAAIDIKTNVTGAMSMLADSFEAAAAVARETAKDPDSARPSRITASGNPHLQAAKAALLIAQADSAGLTAPAIPLHPDAHPFEADGARRECRRCEFPEANARHRIPASARNGSYVANNRRKPNQHVPYRDRPAEAYKTSKI